MLRTTLCTAALLGFGAVASAGELDRESAPTPAAVAPASMAGGFLGRAATPTTGVPVGTELDKESPEAAHRYRGGWGYGGGWGYRGGYGYRSYYGGWGYRPYFSVGFSRPYYGGFYRPYYGGYYGWGYPSYGYSSFSIGFGGGYGCYW